MPFKRKYSEEKLSEAMLMVIDQGVPIGEVSKITGISLRKLQRFKREYITKDNSIRNPGDNPSPLPVVVFHSENIVKETELQTNLDKALLDRAKFLDDVFETKQVLLRQLQKEGRKSKNIDALQRSIKTLSDLEKVVTPDGDVPAVHAKTVNVFQLFNQKLIAEGYKGPELTDADIVKGDGL